MSVRFSKKSVIQTVVLLLLLVVGTGIYLWQQGNLDLFGLFGESPATPPVAKAPVRTPIPPAPKPQPKEEAPVIPNEPVQGRLHDVAFRIERAAIESGVLTLTQGTEPLDTEITLFLQTRPWEVPSARSFKIVNQAAGAGTPQVRVRWRENGQNAPRQREYTEKYTLLLELGPERDRRIPGKIYLALPDEQKSQVAGTFEAEVRGFRLVDGKPDLSVDAVDTLQFLALRELLKNDPDRALKDLMFRHGRLDANPTRGPHATGYLEVQYSAGENQPVAQKFQYVKENDAWRLVRTLEADQLDEAHPYRVPSTRDPSRWFAYLAAQRIEAEVRQKNPGRLVNSVELTPRYSEKHKIGVCEASYKLDEGQPVKTTYLFRQGADGWSLVRELGKRERVNIAKGKVETTR
ncbi:hypothetical protein SVA_0527 [Sulfurifustis variabilis]|uniref:Uncharacterized protein n=1 Tax=Sulfurifustis variabilis TaxID=1675686 RepID=A0A1B4V0W2_9GAMM|nr:hypothetical protein [Sulfurifustis variabilis]BAU47108.1 hypothetical protein SVA_0527 [Sulfurifustis variabilis]